MQDLSAFSARPRLAALLDHFAKGQGYAAGLQGHVSAARGVVPGGVRHHRERRRLRRHRRLGPGAPRLPARLCRIPLRHSLCRLAALHHEPHRSGPVPGLLCRLGRGMLARQARFRGDRPQDLAPHPQSSHRATRRCIWCRPSRPTAGWCSARRRCSRNPTRSPPFRP